MLGALMRDDERQATALGLLNEVARVVTEGLELTPLLQRITDALVGSFDWDHAAFALIDYESDRFTVAALTSRVDTQIRPGHSRKLGSGIVGLVAATGRPVALDDAASHPEYIEVSGGIQTEVCVPIVRGAEVVAVLNLEDRRKRDLSSEFPLIDAVAKQVAGAIANAQLHEEVLRRAQQFELVAELMHATLDAEELDPVLSMLCERLRERFDLLMVMIYLLEPYTSRLDLRAMSTKLPRPDRLLPSLGAGRGITGRAIHLGRAQLVLDVRSDPDYVPLFDETMAELSIPIRFRGRVLGVFNFENDRPQAFSQEAVSLLQLLCDQLAGVVHVAALNQKLSETSNELAQTNQRLLDMNRALTELSIVDSLTGLANRRSFDRALDLEWRRAIRSGQPLSLLFVDIDSFKKYNDSYGHLRGDAVLAEVAKTLASSFTRAGDLVARYGGEEFAALLPATDAAGALELAEQARARVEARGIAHPNAEVGRILTVSAGVVSLVPDVRLQAVAFVEEADRALYQAKAAGRNCVRVAGGATPPPV
jgi:diguanylate cyclase (GGDEF)-like protein